MRLRNLILCLLFCIASASAKDVITKTDGTKLDAKVEEITETLIKYRKASNPTGPIYTIAIESVATIQYENGDVDKFNESTFSEDVAQVSPNGLSDDDLIRMSGEQDVEVLPNGVSDAQLLRMANGYTSDDMLIKKAKKFRMIGWIGGGVFICLGAIVGELCNSEQKITSLDELESFEKKNYLIYGIGVGCGLGAAWCIGFNLKANSLMREARQMQSYSTTIIENDILKFGDNSLTAGINVMGNRMVNSHSLGLSLGLNF